MADKKFDKLPIHQSPEGTAIFPHLNTPDTKFKKEGEFKVKLSMDGTEARGLKKIVDEQMKVAEEEAIEKAKEATKKTKKKVEAKAADLPYFDEVDDEGDETGRVSANFKSTASGISKKTGKPWKRQIPLYDAKGNAMRKLVYGGSTIIVAYTAKPWVNPKNEYGVRLQIEAVQVVELVSEGGSSQRQAGAFGFGARDGYTDDGQDPTKDSISVDEDGDDQTDGTVLGDDEESDKF